MVNRKVVRLLVIYAGLIGSAWGQSSEKITYYHTDHLTSVRMLTDAQGKVVRNHDYLPFGEEIAVTENNQIKFTGKMRDAETGVDYFGARYYASPLGRFMSVDPTQDFNKNISEPQRWNLYPYVTNNPFRYVDPDGHDQEESWLDTFGKVD